MRLLEQYKEHGNLVIAFDYDDTVYPTTLPQVAVERNHLLLRWAKRQGHTLILFTCREELTEDMVDFLEDNGITPDYFNGSPISLESGGPSAKPYFNILLDDKAGMLEAYDTLWDVLSYLHGTYGLSG